MRATTRFVAGSMRTTCEGWACVPVMAQTPPSPAATSQGPSLCSLTGIVATISFVAGSIRVTVPSCTLATQIAASPAAIARSSDVNGIVATTEPASPAGVTRSAPSSRNVSTATMIEAVASASAAAMSTTLRIFTTASCISDPQGANQARGFTTIVRAARSELGARDRVRAKRDPGEVTHVRDSAADHAYQ